MKTPKLEPIIELAAERKGGRELLERLLPEPPPQSRLLKLSDDRVLAEMSRCLFQAGFAWRVIAQKWPGFEQVFGGFDPDWLVFQSPEAWEAIARDTRIVRHAGKIRAVYDNAMFVRDLREEYGSAGRFLHDWPASELVDLFRLLKQRGARLGGMSGQRLLRYLGKDGFMLTIDVVARLQACGLEIRDNPSSQRDLNLIQQVFNDWHQQTGWSYTNLSRVLAFSVGSNYSVETIAGYQSAYLDTQD